MLKYPSNLAQCLTFYIGVEVTGAIMSKKKILRFICWDSTCFWWHLTFYIPCFMKNWVRSTLDLLLSHEVVSDSL